jgi:hypothetical protein
VCTGTDAKAISYSGQSSWEGTVTAVVRTYAANDQGIVCMSDILGYNQVYIVVSKSDASSASIPVGVYYDEHPNRFYWWISRLGAASITYSIYRVTNDGAPSLEVGPTTVASSGGVTFADGYVTVHAPMRNWLIGSGGTTVSGILHGGVRNQCACGGGIRQPPRKYTATVAGIAAGTIAFTLGFLNRSAVSLRNYYHFEPGTPYDAPAQNCEHSSWVVGSGASYTTWFYDDYDGEFTNLYGYAYLEEEVSGTRRYVEVRFSKRLFGKVDVRTLSGEVLDFLSASSDGVDASAATFTITAVV